MNLRAAAKKHRYANRRNENRGREVRTGILCRQGEPMMTMPRRGMGPFYTFIYEMFDEPIQS